MPSASAASSTTSIRDSWRRSRTPAPSARRATRGLRELTVDFAFSAEELAFAEEVRAFLRRHPPESFPIDGMDAGYGSGAHSHAFTKALAAQGWMTMTWPRAFGGQERPMGLKLVLLEELALAGAPFGPL